MASVRVTFAEFKEQMDRMAGLKFAPSSPQTHWEALADLPLPLLKAAVEKAQREVDEFPSPKILRGYADQLRNVVVPIPLGEDRSEDNPEPTTATLPTGTAIPLTRYWRYYCEDCSDLGWLTVFCEGRDSARTAGQRPWVNYRTCERHKAHDAHEWSLPCPCAASNPDVQRRLEHARRVKRSGDAA